MELREWTAAAVGPGEDGRAPDPKKWVEVAVPGSPPEFAGERAVAYRTRFSDPGGMRSLLRLRGLYAHARVWLNGEFVGSHDTYFTPFRTVFAPLAENELVVSCRAPDDRFGGVFETPLVPPKECVPGIRWGATVEPVPEVVLTDLTVGPDEAGETDETGVNAIVTVDTNTDLDGRIRFSMGPEDEDGESALTQVGVTASAGERVTVQGRLSVRDPERWWPRGFGQQARYTVRAALGESERTTKTGFRTTEWGSNGLVVNGTRIAGRGLVSLPNHDGGGAAVERALETDASLVRWYGHVPPKAALDAAAETGVLAWLDVPMNREALDVERARSVGRRLTGEYGHHPSLCVFGVHDGSYRFETTTEETGQRVRRATGGGEHAATTSAAATALPERIPAFAVPGLGRDSADADSWILDGYAGGDGRLDGGTHTRYVVAGTDAAAATRAGRAVEALRRSDSGILTAFVPPEARDAELTVGTGFEPVKPILDDPTAAEPHVMVVNDTSKPVTGDLDWSAGAETGTLSVEVGPVSRTTVGEVGVPSAATVIELSLSVGAERIETSYPRRTG